MRLALDQREPHPWRPARFVPRENRWDWQEQREVTQYVQTTVADQRSL